MLGDVHVFLSVTLAHVCLGFLARMASPLLGLGSSAIILFVGVTLWQFLFDLPMADFALLVVIDSVWDVIVTMFGFFFMHKYQHATEQKMRALFEGRK